MKTLFIFVNTVVVSLILAVIGSSPGTSIDVAPPAARPARLIDRLPAGTMAAVEVRGVARRWEEIRGLPAIAEMQDRLLPAVGMNVEDLPEFVGDEALFALATSSNGTRIVPLALLRPSRIDDATAWISGRSGLVERRTDDVLWVVRDSDARELDRLVRRIGRGPALHLSEVAARLPEGGLVRGWIDPDALRRLLLDRVPGVWPAGLDLLAASIAAELEAVRFAGFRRDLGPDGVMTDAVVAYRPEVLPPEVAAGLAPPDATAVLPAALPADVAALLSFRTQTDAVLPWLRFVAASDPRGPLRNLGFWIDDIQSRTGLDLERDLLDTLDERAWLVVQDGDSTGSWGWVAIVGTNDTGGVEQAMLDLQGWWSTHTWGRTLGLAVPWSREETLGEYTVHRGTFWTPFGELSGPAFLVADHHLLVGSGTDALDTGLRLLETTNSWQPQPGHDAMMVRGASLAALAGIWLDDEAVGAEAEVAAAFRRLLSSIDNASAGVRYEGDAIRVHGELAFRAPTP